MKKKRNKYNNSLDIGSVGETDQGRFEVLSKDAPNWYTIRFLVTGHTKVARRDYVVEGSITDPYFTSKYGVGYLGEGHTKQHQTFLGLVVRSLKPRQSIVDGTQ